MCRTLLLYGRYKVSADSGNKITNAKDIMVAWPVLTLSLGWLSTPLFPLLDDGSELASGTDTGPLALATVLVVAVPVSVAVV